jgi:beta-glucosidase
VTWLAVERRSPASWPTDGTCDVAVVVRNDGERSTTEVVQVYLQDPVAEVARPVRALIGAVRVELPPAATRTVTFRVHADLTAYTGRAGHRQVDPGEVRLLIGASSAEIKGTLSFCLTGPKREVGFERALHPSVEVL